MIDTNYGANISDSVIHDPLTSMTAPLLRTEPGHMPATSSVPLSHGYEGLKLPAPRQRLDIVRLGEVKSELDVALELMLVLLRMAQKLREMGVLHRDSENQAVIAAQKSQVSEMRAGAKWLIGMAVVSGMMAVASVVSGGLGAFKNGKSIKQEKALELKMAERGEQISQVRNSNPNNADCPEVAALERSQMTDKASCNSMRHHFDGRSAKMQASSTVINSMGQMINSALQVKDKQTQATSKEYEVGASIAQTEKQKTEEHMSYNANFMKDMLQLLQQYAQNHNQAWKAAAGAV